MHDFQMGAPIPLAEMLDAVCVQYLAASCIGRVADESPRLVCPLFECFDTHVRLFRTPLLASRLSSTTQWKREDADNDHYDYFP